MKPKRHINKKYMDLSFYVVLTCIIIYILSRIADHAGDIAISIGRGIGWFSAIMKPVVIGFVIAYLFYPLLLKIEKLVGKIRYFSDKPKNKRRLSTFILWILIFLALVFIAWLMFTVVAKQASSFNTDSVVTTIQSYASSFRSFYSQLMQALQGLSIDSKQLETAVDNIGNALAKVILDLGNGIGKTVQNIPSIATTAVFSIIFGIYFMLDQPGLHRYWGNVVKTLIPEKGVKGIKLFLKDVDGVFSGYIRGQLMDAAFMTIMVSIAFSICRIRYAIVIGLLTGIGNLIPYMGPIVGYGSSIVVGLVTGDFKKMAVSIVVLFIIQTIDGNIINPRFLSSSINIHPMLVIIAIIFGNKIGGFMGMVLAVPVAALIKIWFERLVEMVRLRRERKKMASMLPDGTVVVSKPPSQVENDFKEVMTKEEEIKAEAERRKQEEKENKEARWESEKLLKESERQLRKTKRE